MDSRSTRQVERVVLVHVYFPDKKIAEDLNELTVLSQSAGAEVIGVVTATRSAPDAKYFLGLGKAEALRDEVAATKADLVIFNHPLSPGQERNLEKLIQCRVIDRTRLILDIFAQRARSFEGKLQVELALLTHLSTRLIRGWTHLERQRGGIGLRGPGETQLEVDRRLIRNRIKLIQSRLEKIRKQRDQSRRARQKSVIPTVTLVGYTNAGKSTLFNTLTEAAVYVANQLFATLDPTLRRTDLPAFGPVIMADTVGFIRHLPHDLVESFQATLQEVAEADLLIHVIDSQDEEQRSHQVEVDQVLQAIGASSVPRLLVYNKIDAKPDLKPGIERDASGRILRVWVSASKGLGIAALKDAIVESLAAEVVQHHLILSPRQGRLRALLYQKQCIQSEQMDLEGNTYLILKISKSELRKLLRRETGTE